MKDLNYYITKEIYEELYDFILVLYLLELTNYEKINYIYQDCYKAINRWISCNIV